MSSVLCLIENRRALVAGSAIAPVVQWASLLMRGPPIHETHSCSHVIGRLVGHAGRTYLEKLFNQIPRMPRSPATAESKLFQTAMDALRERILEKVDLY